MSSLNNPNIVRARTILLSNGVRINWKNISYFTVEETKPIFKANIRWKYKAGLMEEIIEVGGEDFDPYKYFKKFGIVSLSEDVYINLNKIMLIKEKTVHGPIDKTTVRIVFNDGMQIIKKLDSKYWSWWKDTYS